MGLHSDHTSGCSYCPLLAEIGVLRSVFSANKGNLSDLSATSKGRRFVRLFLPLMSDSYIIALLLGFFLFISIREYSKAKKELERYRIQSEVAEEAKRYALYNVWKAWGKEGLAKVKEASSWAEHNKDEFEGKDIDAIILAKQQDRAKRLKEHTKPVGTENYLKALQQHPYYRAYIVELDNARETHNRIKELLYAYDEINEDERKELDYYLVFINFYLEHYDYLSQENPLSLQLTKEVKLLTQLKADIQKKLNKR